MAVKKPTLIISSLYCGFIIMWTIKSEGIIGVKLKVTLDSQSTFSGPNLRKEKRVGPKQHLSWTYKYFKKKEHHFSILIEQIDSHIIALLNIIFCQPCNEFASHFFHIQIILSYIKVNMSTAVWKLSILTFLSTLNYTNYIWDTDSMKKSFLALKILQGETEGNWMVDC